METSDLANTSADSSSKTDAINNGIYFFIKPPFLLVFSIKIILF
jgi:hypothetical protein